MIGTKKIAHSTSRFFLLGILLCSCLTIMISNCYATTVTLQWGASTGATGYKIYYQPDSSTQPFTGTGATQGPSPVDVLTNTNATISGLDPLHSYSFAVTAYNESGESSYSNIVTVPELTSPTVTAFTIPSTYSMLTVPITAFTATDNKGVTGYCVTLDNSSSGCTWSGSMPTSITFPSYGSQYAYAWAKDAAGNISTSLTATVNISDNISPTVSMSNPANGSVLSGTTTITATATDNVVVTNVEFYDNGNLLYATNITPYSFNWNTTSVANGSHTLNVRAYDAAGNNGQSNVSVSVSNLTTTVPDAPSMGTATAGNAQAIVSFSAPSYDGGSAITGYTVTSSPGNITKTGAASPITVTGLTNGTSYTFTVRATNAIGIGAASAVSNSIVPTGGTGDYYNVIFGNTTDSNYPGTIEDTYINLNTSVNSTSPNLNTYTWPANKPANAILIKWDISAIPANAQVVSATLYLYMTASGGDSLYTIPISQVINKSPVISSCNGYTHDGTNAWNPSNLPYNSIPLAQSDIAAPVDSPQVNTTSGYKTWNVTNIIQNWITNPSSNYGMLFNSSTAATSDSYRYFASSESTDTSIRPKLVITYQLSAGLPGAPTIGSAAAGNAQATVFFTAPASNGGSPITGYTVSSSAGQTATGTSSPITVTGLINGTAYTFTVKATNAIGTSAASAASNSVTPTAPATVPGAPTIGSAAAGNAQATVFFTAPASNGGSPITGYTVSSSAGQTATGTSSPITVTGLINGTAYTFTVTATNAAGTSAASGASNSVTPATIPGAPTIGTATQGNAQTSVSFTAPASNGGSQITGYTVTSSAGQTATGTASPITVTGLTNGTAYTFTVKATNAIGTGAASAASNSVTPATLPGVPTIGTATAGNAQASVSFTAPASNGGSPITDYTVTSSAGHTATGTASPITVTGLTNGTAYTFTVKATNAIGSSPSSAASNSVIPSAPTVPPSVSIITPVSGATYGAPATIVLTATAMATNATITKVEFYKGTTLLKSITSAPYTYTWSNVSKGSYSITAKAYDSRGATKTSSPVSLKVFSAATGVSFTSISSASPQPVGTSVTFKTSASGGSGSYQYQFLVKNPVTGWATTQGYSTNSSFIWNTSGLPTGTYYIQVMARNTGSTAIYEASKTIKYVLK